MKIYSELTGKEYKTVEECQKAEEEIAIQLAEKQAKEDQLKKERKERAAEVDAAYKNYMKHLNEFMKDYGSYHVSYRSDDGLFSDFGKYAFTW